MLSEKPNVPLEGIEPPTSRLRSDCSTPELQRQILFFIGERFLKRESDVLFSSGQDSYRGCSESFNGCKQLLDKGFGSRCSGRYPDA